MLFLWWCQVLRSNTVPFVLRHKMVFTLVGLYLPMMTVTAIGPNKPNNRPMMTITFIGPRLRA